MAIQSGHGRLAIFEDFAGLAASATLADATAGTRYNDLTLIAIGGDVTFYFTVDESGGVASFTPGADAGDGTAITTGLVYQASRDGTITMEARFKNSSATDWRTFVGWQETVALDETVNPFTLSGTSLTSNNGGNVVGFYTDSSATTDDFRFHASLDGVELTTAALSQAVDGSTTLGALGIRANATLTADSWCIARVIVHADGSAEGWFGHESMPNNLGLTKIAHLKAGSLDATALLYPILIMAAGSTGSPVAEVDYFAAKGARDWAA